MNFKHAVVRLLKERQRDGGRGRVCDRRPRGPLAGRGGRGSSTLLGGVVLHEAESLATLLDVRDVEPASCGRGRGDGPSDSRADRRRLRPGDRGAAAADVKYSAGEELEGTLQIALASGENVAMKGFPLAGHPAIVRTRAAKQALNMLRLALLNHAASER